MRMNACLCILEVWILGAFSVGWWGVGFWGISLDVFAFVLSENLLDGNTLEFRLALSLL